MYLMNNRLQLRHNDFHFQNIMIKQLDRPIQQEYKINTTKYTRLKKHQILIYDYDLSFLHNIGPNSDLIYFSSHGVSNTNNKAKDMWTVLHTLKAEVSGRPRDHADFETTINSIIEIILGSPYDDLRNPIAKLLNQQIINKKDLDHPYDFCNYTNPKSVPCIEPTEPIFENIHPDKVIERYIVSYRGLLALTELGEYKQKYIKYKQKYINLKNKDYK